ncbi:hypothetical protein AA313_de0207095 [Arthrobotrys entomopaga]|nr:hypothetical protein AA313_de0207095 [Arthrobotrys entomopaga]
MALQAPESPLMDDEYGPTINDLPGGNFYAEIATTNWLKDNAPVRFSANVVKEIYQSLEKEAFSPSSLFLLENLQYVEQYLWPNYNEDSTDELVISLVMIATVKGRKRAQIWGTFETNTELFSSFFRRVLIMSLSTSLSFIARTHVLCFVAVAFQSLDNTTVRKECAPLVGIGIWQNLQTEEVREARLRDNPTFKKAWRAAVKKYSLADQKLQARMNFQRSWLYMLTLDFISVLYSEPQGDTCLYAERVIEFFTDLLSQLPTRRYVHGLLEDLQILPCLRLSPLFFLQSNKLLRDLTALLEHFYYFEIDNECNPNPSHVFSSGQHKKNTARLQREVIIVSRNKLTVMGLANCASVAKKEDLEVQLSVLDDEELASLYRRLSFRQNYPQTLSRPINRQFMLCTIVERFSQRPDPISDIRRSSILPTERSLIGISRHSSSYDGNRPLPIPKLNLQYLSTLDFLWRIFTLYRDESFFEIRRDLQDTVRKLRPKLHQGNVIFSGKSKMALQINRISILEVAPSRVGETIPSFIRAELDLHFDNMNTDVKKEWESLRPDDVVFLLSIRPRDRSSGAGIPIISTSEDVEIRVLRCAEVVGGFAESKGIASSQSYEKRKLHVFLDRMTYMNGGESPGSPGDIYESLNIIVRRKGVGNNFKSVLTSIQLLVQGHSNLIPQWLRDTFLGCGDPTEACFPNLRPLPKTINFGETFHDMAHLQETLRLNEFNIVLPSKPLTPPFVLTEVESSRPADTIADSETSTSKLQYEISNEQLIITPLHKSRANSSQVIPRYTEAQVQAIISGTNPGLTLVVGPPGTGKTDVATQIICNLYRNFPNERTLVIAHSNQALNQLLHKIGDRAIDERHLLRLGHGEDDFTQLMPACSKLGRIESLTELRNTLLQEVDRLASSINAPGAHSNSCETASYFNQVYIKPLWSNFTTAVSLSPTTDTILNEFPFYDYFPNAHQSLAKSQTSFQTAISAAESYFREISNLFIRLEDIMPFELLRSVRDKTNYLLATEARIIAMTSTYAAIQRGELVKNGFRYDNIVMEEAAQITEIETFIPFTLQKSTGNGTPLKRIVLCGDHLQNPPVVQNTALRYFANLEQSLFARLIRLGVPSIRLDKQGRARPTIAELYSWRYLDLGNLTSLYQQQEFLCANAGFQHEFQFVNVEDFKGKGEQEPSPHFIQNLGEAEYAVALFQYMRLLGYPANKISIITSYSGQLALIKDIINMRCSRNPLFGSPAHLTTIDKFQGEQNDYVIVSLVRTKSVGYLRDLRRLTVALSRARLGLYVLGRLKTFQSCFELRDAFRRLLQKPTKLELVTGEMWPATRSLTTLSQATVMEGVEHLGKYVFEMTETKLESLKRV